MTLTDAVGLVAGILTTVSFVPQVVKIRCSGSARDISYTMYACFIAGVSLWLYYGIAIGALPVALNNAVVLLLAVTIIVLKYRAEARSAARESGH